MELLATTVGIVTLDLKADSPMATRIQVTGLTDSQVSANVVSRGQTTAFPLCCVVMELAAQLEARGVELMLDWIPRDVNAEADRLADGNSVGFRDRNRVGKDIREVPWLILPELLREGEAFYRDGPGRAAPAPAAPRAPGRKRLREREPW